MGTQYIDWDTNWTTALNNLTINDTASTATGSISNDQKISTVVSIEVTYGTSTTEGVKVFVESDVDGTNFEDAFTSVPDVVSRVYQLPYTDSQKFYKQIVVPATDYSAFRVRVTNDSSATATGVYVRYKQAVVTTA